MLSSLYGGVKVYETILAKVWAHMKKYLLDREVAEALRLTPRQIRKLAQAGIIPSVKVGKNVRFNEERIVALLERWERERGQKRRAEKQ